MEENNKVYKIKLKTVIVIICIIASIFSGIIWAYLDNYTYTYEEYTGEYQKYCLTYNNDYEYYEYERLIIYNWLYYKNTPCIIKNYNTYTRYMEIMEYDNPIIYTSDEQIEAIERLDESFFETNSLILCFTGGLLDVQEQNDTVNLMLYKDGMYIYEEENANGERTYTYTFNAYFIPVSKDIEEIIVNYESAPTFTTGKNICKAIIIISIFILIVLGFLSINKKYNKQIKYIIKIIANILLAIWVLFNILFAFYALYSNLPGTLEIFTIRDIFCTFYISDNFNLWNKKRK